MQLLKPEYFHSEKDLDLERIDHHDKESIRYGKRDVQILIDVINGKPYEVCIFLTSNIHCCINF